MRPSSRHYLAQSEARERRIAHWVLVTVSAFAIAAWIATLVLIFRGEPEPMPGVEREGWAP